MEHYSIVIFLLAISITVMALSPKIKIPYPILMIVAGIAVGFIPDFRHIRINPEVIFLIFLPPLLSNAAFNLSFNDFKHDFKTISVLAVSLVFITTLGIAYITHLMLPQMGWALAFVIGAILSPPDAVAATSIIKGMKLSHRTHIILEGESLVNDASALIAYRFAVAAVAGTSFIWWEASLEFIIAIAGGIIVGYCLWQIFEYIVKKTHLGDTVVVSLNLLLPFVAYLLSEELRVSGVLAVVTTGIMVAIRKDIVFSKDAKNQSIVIWDLIVFMLNGLVFILIGLEFPRILEHLSFNDILWLTFCSFMIFLTALIIRFVIIFFQKVWLDKSQYFKLKKKKNIDGVRYNAPLNWKDVLIIGWSGMRGIVSLATALALPVVLTNGERFPYRSTILFLTVMVVVMMLLIQGLGLPFIIKWLKIDDIPPQKIKAEDELLNSPQ